MGPPPIAGRNNELNLLIKRIAPQLPCRFLLPFLLDHFCETLAGASLRRSRSEVRDGVVGHGWGILGSSVAGFSSEMVYPPALNPEENWVCARSVVAFAVAVYPVKPLGVVGSG